MRFAHIVVVLFFAFIAGIVGLTVHSGKELKFRTVFEGGLPENDDAIVAYRYVKGKLPSQDWVGIVVRARSGTIYTTAGLATADRLTKALEAADFVVRDSVRSIANEKVMLGGAVLSKEPLVRADDLTVSAGPDRVRQRINRHPLIARELVAQDGTAFMVGAYLRKGFRQSAVVEQLRRIVRENTSPELEILPLGNVVVDQEIDEGIVEQAISLLFGALGVMIVIAGIYRMFFAGIVMVILNLVGVILLVCGMVLFEIPASVVFSAAPLLLVALGSSYFFYVARAIGRATGPPPLYIWKGVWNVSKPIIFSAVATAVGFGTLVTFKILSVKEFGLIVAAGTILMAGLALLVYPWFFVAWDRLVPSLMNNRGAGWPEKLTGGLVSWSYRLTAKLVLAVLVLFTLTGLPRLEAASNPYDYFPPDHIVRRGMVLAQQFGGNSEIVLALTSDEFPMDAAFLSRLLELEQRFRKIRGVGHVVGLATLADYVNNTYEGKPATFDEDIASKLENMLEPTDLERVLSIDQQTVFIRVWAYAPSTLDVDRIMTEMRLGLTVLFPAYEKVSAEHPLVAPTYAFGGFDPLWVAINRYLVTGKMWNLGTSFGGIWVIAFIMLGRGGWRCAWKRATIVTLPLSVSLVGTLGIMGLLGIELDLATCVITAVGIGVGEDFAVHLLHQYEETGSFARSAGELFRYAALSAVSFSVFRLSMFQPLQDFAWLVLVILVLSFTAAVLMVPSLVKDFGLRPKGG